MNKLSAAVNARGRPVVLHVIIGLNVGGAERTLLKLCQGLPEFEHHVVSLTGSGSLEKDFVKAGAKLLFLNFQNPWRAACSSFQLLTKVKTVQPALIQTWLYHAELLSVIVKIFNPAIPLLWNLRHTDFAPGHSRRTRLIRRMLVLLSWVVPSEIICAGNKVASFHAGIGYRQSRLNVISNGVDLENVVFRPQTRRKIRFELDLAKNAVVIGFIAKWDAQKGVEIFLEAAQKTLRSYPRVVFLMVGNGLDASNGALTTLLDARGLSEAVILQGQSERVNELMCAVDVVVSASLTEGFPNVVVEAMACGRPVVATDVGESQNLIEPAQCVVAPGSATSLADGLVWLLTLPSAERRRIGRTNRQTVEKLYSMQLMLSRYADLWTRVSGATSREIYR